jgi:MoxR-like ATPase
MAKTKKSTVPDLPIEGLDYHTLRRLIGGTLQANISVLLRGHPGVGKSALARDLAAEMGLPLIDIRLAQRDPAELAGVHFPNREDQVLELFPPAWVRTAVNEPTLVFLDEINAGVTRLHQAAAYQIVLERRVGPFSFHPDTVVMAAGNLAEDNAIVSHLSSALCNRFAHFTMRVDADAWLAWAADHGIHPAIMAYIGRFGAEALYDNNGDHAFASPRSWEMASRVFSVVDESDAKRVMAACVGVVAAEKFSTYLRIYQRVNAKRVVLNGQVIDFTRGKQAEPSFIYAAVFSVAAWLVHEGEVPDSALPNIVKFLNSKGLDPEYVFLFLRQIKVNSALLDSLKRLPDFQYLAGQLVGLHVGLYQ